MTKLEADEIASKIPEGSQYWDCEHDTAIEFGHAHGFLEGLNSPEALERPEVLALIGSLEKIKRANPIYWPGAFAAVIDEARSAISNYHAALGKVNK